MYYAGKQCIDCAGVQAGLAWLFMCDSLVKQLMYLVITSIDFLNSMD